MKNLLSMTSSSINTNKLKIKKYLNEENKLILPFNFSDNDNDSLKITNNLNKSICLICDKNFSNYVCPNCNGPYCSINCYKSDKHGQCNQRFLLDQLNDDIKLGDNNDDNIKTKRKTLKMLQKLNDDDNNDFNNKIDDIDDDTLQRLGSLDLENSNPEVIFNTLNEEEKKQFLTLLNPNNTFNLNSLLHSFQPSFNPWYTPISEADFDEDDRPLAPPFELQLGGQALCYNLLSILFAYAYVLRRYGLNYLSNINNTSTDVKNARNELITFVPFLREKKSTLILSDCQDAIFTVWSRIPSVSFYNYLNEVLY